MGNITGSLGGIAGGVSQQPDILRFPGQCTEQVNMWIDTAQGLRRRGAVTLIDILVEMLQDTPHDQVFFHWFSLESEDYVAVLTPSEVQVFDLLGNAQPTTSANYAYIQEGFSKNNLSSIQVGEYNLIANKQIPCAMLPDIADDKEFITIFVKEGMEWGVKYTVRNGNTVLASYTAPAGDTVNTTTMSQINSEYVATQLRIGLESTVLSDGYTVVQDGNIIKLVRALDGRWVYSAADGADTVNVFTPFATPPYSKVQPSNTTVSLLSGTSFKVTRSLWNDQWAGLKLNSVFTLGKRYRLKGTALSVTQGTVKMTVTGTNLPSQTVNSGQDVEFTCISSVNSISFLSHSLVNPIADITVSSDILEEVLLTWVSDESASAPVYPSHLFIAEDGRGGANISCTTREVPTLDKLPPRTSDGHWVHVSGKSNTSLDDFYMRYTASSNLEGGRWEETYNPLEPTRFDAATMPHALVKLANGTFHFTPLDGSFVGGSVIDTWTSRKTGDKDSNPEPAFIGKGINFMTMVQNRLTLMTDDHINMSKTRDEFNMFSSSALADTETDPIELTSPGTEIAYLFSAHEHDQYLVVMGAKRQFAIPLKSALSRATAALVPTTAYEVNPQCRPTVAGNGVYFAFQDGAYSGVREYTTGNVENINVAESITSHVNKYIPQGLSMLVADNQNNVIYAVPTEGHDVYVYQYLVQDGERVMSAWHKLTLNDVTPLDIHVVRGNVYIVGLSSTGAGVGLFELDLDTTVFLDYPVQGTVVEGLIDLTEWKFKTSATLEDIRCVVTSGQYAGMRIQVQSFEEGILAVQDPALFNGATVTVGLKYTSTYTPTMPVLRDSQGKAMQLDRLTVNDLIVSMYDTGGFKAKVSAPYYEDSEQDFTGREVGSTFVVGGLPVSERTEHISVWHDARNVDVSLVCDTHQDMIVQAIEYKASYSPRGGRY